MNDTASNTGTETERTNKRAADSGTYHHGDLRRALLDAVGEIIEEKGVGAVSLREAARRAGVSHGAPAHHFGDKLGLITAYAAEGFEQFGARMQQASDSATTPKDRLNAIGLEYLRFAMEERAYFEVMFRSEMHNRDDDELTETYNSCFGVLSSVAEEIGQAGPDGHVTDTTTGHAKPTSTGGDTDAENKQTMALALRAWTMVHGLATLWLDGAISELWDGDDIYELALEIFESDLG